MDKIRDHQKSKDTIEKANRILVSKKKQSQKKINTKGWKFLIRWKDGLQPCVPPADLKESYPVQLAEYTKLYEREDKPAFAWWVSYALKKRDHVVSAVKARVLRRNQGSIAY